MIFWVYSLGGPARSPGESFLVQKEGVPPMSQKQRSALVVNINAAKKVISSIFSKIESSEAVGLCSEGLWLMAAQEDSRLQQLEAKL